MLNNNWISNKSNIMVKGQKSDKQGQFFNAFVNQIQSAAKAVKISKSRKIALITNLTNVEVREILEQVSNQASYYLTADVYTDTHSIFLSNLPKSLSKTKIQETFAKYGQIKKMYFIQCKYSMLASVEFINAKSGENAMLELDGTKLGNNTIHITLDKNCLIPTIPDNIIEEHTVDEWYYVDSNKNVRGPYSSEIMRGWWDKRLFPNDLYISHSCDINTFQHIADVFNHSSMCFQIEA
jgi:RNA recognition motif-containing protein